MQPTSNGISHLDFGIQHEARLYRLLVKELPEYAIFFVNPDGRTATWNAGVEKILGYTEAEFLDRPFSILFTAEDRIAGVPERELINALENGSASDERWLVRKDGERIFANGRLIASLNDSGELVGYTKIVRDQTARKQAEQRLIEIHREQRKLARALDLTHSMIRDLDGTIRVWTRGAEELYGWTADEAVGAISHELLKPEFPEPLDQIHERLKREGSWEGALTHRAKDGRELFVASSWVLYSSDDVSTTVIEVNNDVTATKTAELALQQSEEHFRKAFEESPVGKAFVRPDTGRYLRVNAAFAQMLGYSTDELMQMTIAEISYPNDSDVGLDDAQAVFRGELPRAHFEKRYVAKNGAVVWGNIHEVLIRNARGESLYNLAVIEDVTARKQMEGELRRSNEDLSQFSYVAAHDLQTPLRNVRTAAQLLARRYDKMLDAGALGFVQAVISGTQKMQELLTALLAYAREAESAGRGTAELPAVIQNVLGSLQSEIERAGAQIVCGELPVVRGDFLHISRLFQNLMENALKYRSQEPLRVRIDAQRQADHWLVSFRDNGMGIPPAQHDAIFAPLRRLHGQEIPGTGMGLAICKKIVERLGGRIWVESNVGEGAVFYFTLPAI